MPRAVTPWLTAFKAYSGEVPRLAMAISWREVRDDNGDRWVGCRWSVVGSCLTDLHQLSAVDGLAGGDRNGWMGVGMVQGPYLGEKVVRENEYRSAMMCN